MSSDKKSITKRILPGESISSHTQYDTTVVVSKPYVEVGVLGGKTLPTGDLVIRPAASPASEEEASEEGGSSENASGGKETSLTAESGETSTAYRASDWFPEAAYEVVYKMDGAEQVIVESSPRDDVVHGSRNGASADAASESRSESQSEPGGRAAARLAPIRFIACDDAYGAREQGPSTPVTPWRNEDGTLAPVPEDAPAEDGAESGSAEGGAGARGDSGASNTDGPSLAQERYVYHFERAVRSRGDEEGEADVRVRRTEWWADGDGVLSVCDRDSREPGASTGDTWTLIRADSADTASIEHYFWLSAVQLSDARLQAIESALRAGEPTPLTPVQVDAGADPMCARDSRYAGALPRGNARPGETPPRWSGLGIFLVDHAAVVEKKRQAMMDAFRAWDRWNDATAKTKTLAELVAAPVFEFGSFGDGQDRAYLHERLQTVSGEQDMSGAWDGLPARLRNRVSYRPGGYGPPQTLFESPEIEAQTEAVAQWLVGYSRKHDQLHGRYVERADDLAQWLRAPGLHMTWMDTVDALDAGRSTDAVERLAKQTAALFSDLATSEPGQRALLSLYERSRLYETVSRLGATVEVTDDALLQPLNEPAYTGRGADTQLAPTDGVQLAFKLTRKSIKSSFTLLEAFAHVIPVAHDGDRRGARLVAALVNGSLSLDPNATSPTWSGPGGAISRVGSTKVAAGKVTVKQWTRPSRPNVNTAFVETGDRVRAYHIVATGEGFERSINGLKLPLTMVLDGTNAAMSALAIADKLQKGESWTLDDAVSIGFVLTDAVSFLRETKRTDTLAGLSDDVVKAGLKKIGVVLIIASGAISVAQSAERGDYAGAAGHALYAAGSLVLSSGSSLGMAIFGAAALPAGVVLGVLLLAAGGALLYAQHRFTLQDTYEKDPLWAWLPGRCVWGRDYPSEAPAALAGVNLDALFTLVHPDTTFDGPNCPSAPPAEPLQAQSKAFVEKAYSFPVEVRVDDEQVDTIGPAGGPPRGSKHNPDRRRVTALTLRVKPTYMPAAASIEVEGRVDPRSQEIGEAGFRFSLHYVQEGDTYRYCVTEAGKTPDFSQEAVQSWAQADHLDIRVVDDCARGRASDAVTVSAAGLGAVLDAEQTVRGSMTQTDTLGQSDVSGYSVQSAVFTVNGTAMYAPLSGVGVPGDGENHDLRAVEEVDHTYPFDTISGFQSPMGNASSPVTDQFDTFFGEEP